MSYGQQGIAQLHFFLSVSIKDRSLHKASWASHGFIIPSIYLDMGAGKTCCSLVVDPALSRPTDWRQGRWRSLHRTESGTQEWGLGVQVWTGTWTPRTEEEWVSPACAWGTSGACVFGAPSWAHWFANRRRVGTTCLNSSIVVRTKDGR